MAAAGAAVGGADELDGADGGTDGPGPDWTDAELKLDAGDMGGAEPDGDEELGGDNGPGGAEPGADGCGGL